MHNLIVCSEIFASFILFMLLYGIIRTYLGAQKLGLKSLLCLTLLALVGSARAQVNPANALPTVSGTAAEPPIIVPVSNATLTPADWIKLGGPFGPGKAWQFGFDKSPTLGAEMGFDFLHSTFLGGTERDVFVLAHKSQQAMHLGGFLGWTSDNAHFAYLCVLGVNIGPATASLLNRMADKIPLLESLADWPAPPALAYLGNILTLDGLGGPYGGADRGKWAGGCALKASIPLSDLWALVHKPTGN